MARLIDADSFRNEMNEYIYPITGNNLIGGADVFYRVLHLLEDAPTIDPAKDGYVSFGAYEQVRWERDVAIDQLNSYGVQLGEKAELQRVKHGKWIDNGIPESILCGCSECGYTCGAYSFNYCPNCGARMDGE